MKCLKCLTMLLMTGLLSMSGTGCATRTGLLRMDVGVPPNPPQGAKVKIVRVTDRRTFSLNPKDNSVPHLPKKYIGDLRTQERAVSYFDAPLLNVQKRVFLLTDGETVPSLVEKTLTKALREAGYRVVSADDPQAIALEAEVVQLWSWFSQRKGIVSCLCEVRLKGNLPPFESGALLQSKKTIPAPVFVVAGHYHHAVMSGLGYLETDLQEKLKANGHTKQSDMRLQHAVPAYRR